MTIGIIAIACGDQARNTADTPTEAYKRLYAAVKGKNTEEIKKLVSKSTQNFAEQAAAKQNTPIEKMYENGFTGTTFSETLPEIRDERVKGNFGAVEVWNSKERLWEDLPFVLEDGTWKLAFGDMFANTYQSPGRGRDHREKEAANAMGRGPAFENLPLGNTNVNANAPTRKANTSSNANIR
jgi:hypothetical protein